MSCVIAIVENGEVHMGCDSAVVQGDDRDVRSDPKAFKRAGAVVGVVGLWRVIDLMHYNFRPPMRRRGQPYSWYMRSVFIPALRQRAKEEGILQRKDGALVFPADLLVGIGGHLYEIGDNLDVGEPQRPYLSIGSGAAFAMGALHATCGLEVKHRLTAALKAAETFSGTVCRPFRFVRGGRK